MSEAQTCQALAGLRVLELADEKGQFCGKLLGDLGADVIKIEPPAASPAATSGHSSTTFPTRSAACLSGTTTPPNAALPSIWKPPTDARFSAPGGDGGCHSGDFPPRLPGVLGLDYESLREQNAGLIMCS